MIQMKKLNNKGFSLVELIIVIAIMAILVGVVGTQVIPYLENSRKAKDTQIFSAWNTAAVSAYSTEAGNLDALKTYVITVSKDANVSVTAEKGYENLAKTFLELTDLADDSGNSKYNFATECSSKAGKDVTKVEITVNGGNGQVYTHVTNATPSKYSFDDIENK
jgi:prepilin-type N-terminal cleavage/methylation domain-containing protein